MEIKLGEDFLKEIEKIREEENSKITEEEKTYIEAKIAVINELIDEFTPIQAEEETAQAVEVAETEVSLENNNYLGGVL